MARLDLKYRKLCHHGDLDLHTPPPPLQRKMNNQGGNQEIKYRKRTIYPLTEAGSKVYLLFEFSSYGEILYYIQ
jgi:hypothetical protein